jgi:tRNA(Ile)-lysidine synthase
LSQLALQPLRTSTGLDRRRLGALQPSTRRQLLVIWLAQQGVTALNAALLEQLTDRLALSAAGGSCDLPGGWRLQWQGDNLSLQPPAAGH